MAKLVYSNNDLSTADGFAIQQLFDWGDRAVITFAPYMAEKLVDDMLKAAREGKRSDVVSWLASKGYQLSDVSGGVVSTPSVSGGVTTDPSQMDEGNETTVNGQKRFIVKDYYGHTYAETPTGAGVSGSGNIDYVWDNGRWVYITPKTNSLTGETIPGAYIAPSETTLSGKVWNQAQGWITDTTTGGTATDTTPQYEIDRIIAETGLTNAQTQTLLADLNSPNQDVSNNAAMELYSILTNYANNNNANAVSQWGSQAGAFNQAYQNAIAQNQQLMEMSTQPINLVAYLNRIRGETPPNWNLPNYQQMPDAFTGWNQPAPTTQPLPDVNQIKSILGQLGLWGGQQQTTTPTNYVLPTGETHPVSEPVTNWSNVITPDRVSSTPANVYSGVDYGNQTWGAVGNGTYATPRTQVGNTQQSTIAYGVPNTVQDTLAVLKAANPSVNYRINANGEIEVG